ncbi:MAG TPA: NAD(P)-binding domain-containing protein [bacterium]|jgi:thioredoxin reductase/ferredoxin
MLESLIYIVTAVIAVGIPVIYFLRAKKQSAHAEQVLKKAVERGMDEPVSLHPYIDPDLCMGMGACVQACPEKDVLGLINNRGALINPSHCVGHGMCEAACPVDAITLVFGTEKRGVDIPFVSGTFETNVPGIYIAGELGGMGLIRNAVKQGREAVEYIAKSLNGHRADGVYDLVIVGAGPAGVAASLQAKLLGLNFVTLDQEDLGGTILTYPRRKLVMTQPVELPVYGTLKAREIQKENLLEIFMEVFARTDLKIRSGEHVDDILKENDCFRVVTPKGSYPTQRVLLAIGRRGSPRKLDVPGEKSAKVAYRLLEPEQFQKMKLLVVGGGDSAVESALALSEQRDNVVHVSYRRETFFRLKEGNQKRIEAALKRGAVVPVFNSGVTRIDANEVHLDTGGTPLVLPNDYVFIFAGGELPTEFLKKVGIDVQRKFGQR